MNQYDARSWFWTLPNRPGEVYSSAAAKWAGEGDADYRAWLAEGNIASTHDRMTDGELAQVLAAAGLEGPPVLAVNPKDWTDLPAGEIIRTVTRAGVVISSTQGLGGHYPLIGDPFARTLLYAVAHGALPNGGPIDWPVYGGTVRFDSVDNVLAVSKGLMDYLQAWSGWAVTRSGAPPAWGEQQTA